MSERRTRSTRRLGEALLAGALAALLAGPAPAHEKKAAQEPPETMAAPDHMMSGQAMEQHMRTMPGMANLMMPRMDSTRGKTLFVSKGCVTCHAVNGVGGHDAAALDAHTMPRMMNPFEFAAKMWRMAPAMLYAQEEALGFQITFTGAELADIIAFVHDDAVQHTFMESDITPDIRRLMDHGHGEPGGGEAAHGEEIGHRHGAGEAKGHMD